jgi:hypothetical protein
MALSKTTQDHDEIRQWAESRGAIPAEVASTDTKGQTGILRIEFPKAKNANDSALKEISWEEFFEKFDASGLALVYQELTADGEQSNFNKLIYPENSKAESSSGRGKKASSKAAAKSQPAKGASAAKKSTSSKSTGKSAAKAPAKKAPAKKAAAKKSPAKKTAVKKSPAKQTASKKTPSKR